MIFGLHNINPTEDTRSKVKHLQAQGRELSAHTQKMYLLGIESWADR